MIKVKKDTFTDSNAKAFSKHLVRNFLREGFTESDVLKEKYSEFFRSSSNTLSEKIYQNIKSNVPKIILGIEQKRNAFEEKLSEIWKEPFQLLDVFLFFLTEVLHVYNEDQRKVIEEKQRNAFEALIRINFRACKTGYEVLTLLRSGFPDGAYARWRTLHELAVTALFIQKSDDDLAERYLLHENIESYQGMLAYQKFKERNNNTPFPEEVMKSVEKKYRELIAKYGEEYKEGYGWASKALNKTKPNFTHVEEFVNLDHARPHVKMANHSVHSTAKGNFFSFGVPNSKTMLLSGASQIGMAGPGYDAAISLMQTCTALLLLKPFPQNAVVMQTMQKFVNEIGVAFTKIDERMI